MITPVNTKKSHKTYKFCVTNALSLSKIWQFDSVLTWLISQTQIHLTITVSHLYGKNVMTLLSYSCMTWYQLHLICQKGVHTQSLFKKFSEQLNEIQYVPHSVNYTLPLWNSPVLQYYTDSNNVSIFLNSPNVILNKCELASPHFFPPFFISSTDPHQYPFKPTSNFWNTEEVCWRQIRAIGWFWKHRSFVFCKKLLDRECHVHCSINGVKKPAVFPLNFWSFLLPCFS